MTNKKKLGVALGSGGFRGYALIGALKAFVENNIEIDYISGASVGSLIAAHYAVFKDCQKLETDLVDGAKDKLLSIIDFSLRGGLIKGEKFKILVDKILEDYTFTDTAIPLRIVATDLAAGKPFIFSSGNLADCVQASCSVPVIFEPVKEGAHRFVDGGLCDPVPVDCLSDLGADITVAVNLYHKNEFIDRDFNVVKVALRTSRIALYNLAQASIKQADVIINPDTSAFVRDNDFRKFMDERLLREIIALGYRETIAKIPAIKKTLA